jgi:Transposase
MIYAAIDIHKTLLQVAVLDDSSGHLQEERLPASPEALADWASRRKRAVEAVAIEATTGWRWVARELHAAGLEVRLADPGQASALQGRRRRPKTDRLDARWLVRLLASELLPAAWSAPEEIQRLCDRTRLRKAIVDERRRWAQRLHALLLQESWPCRRARLLTAEGQRWPAGLALPLEARAYAETALALMAALEPSSSPSRATCAASPGATAAARRCRRSPVWGRCSPATCWPRSATSAVFGARARSPGRATSTRSSPSRATRVAAASSPSRAPRTCAGRSSRPHSTAGVLPARIVTSTGAPPAAVERAGPSWPSRAASATAPSASCTRSRAPERGLGEEGPDGGRGGELPPDPAAHVACPEGE